MSDTSPTTPTAADQVEIPVRFEHLDKLEKWWLRIGIAMLVVFVTVVVADAMRNAPAMTHGPQTVDPAKLMQTEPFSDPGPGIHKRADGGYDAIVVAYTFGFLPQGDLVVPANKPIYFQVSSLDVVHGFQIPGVSNVNLEVLPGHVTQVRQTFSKPGRYLILCHEYCGSKHQFMVSHIRVLEPGDTPEAYAERMAAKTESKTHTAAMGGTEGSAA